MATHERPIIEQRISERVILAYLRTHQVNVNAAPQAHKYQTFEVDCLAEGQLLPLRVWHRSIQISNDIDSYSIVNRRCSGSFLRVFETRGVETNVTRSSYAKAGRSLTAIERPTIVKSRTYCMEFQSVSAESTRRHRQGSRSRLARNSRVKA